MPIYFGAPNVARDMPKALDEMVLDYRSFNESVSKLAQYIQYLDTHDEAYEAMLSWKHMKRSSWPQSFRRIVKLSTETPSFRCQVRARFIIMTNHKKTDNLLHHRQVCQKVAEARVQRELKKLNV